MEPQSKIKTETNEQTQSMQSVGGKQMLPPELDLQASQLKGGGAGSGPSTFGGDWEAKNYNLQSSGTRRGANIELHFNPGNGVDATQIGLIQTAKAINNGKVTYIGDPTRETHGIKSGDAKEIDSATKETDEGTHIDQLGQFANPLYATGATNPGDTLETTPTNPQWGQHGWRYVGAGGKVVHQEAILKDTPTQPDVAKDSSNVFEVAAVALSGTQKGTYFGSVRWGWRTDAAGVHSKVPLEVVSQGVPTSSFLKAGELWNSGKTSAGADTIDMPIIDVKIAGDSFTPYDADPQSCLAPISKGTRLQVVTPWRIPLQYGTVKIVDGPRTGDVVHVNYSDWNKIVDERT
jgi:hypothetical protein